MSRRAAPPELKQLTLGGDPRVQLLPPSVKAREKAKGARRALVMLVVLALVVAGGGYAFAWLRAADAQSQLLGAQARTSELLTQQAEYADGTRVASLVAKTVDLQLLGTSTEVLWDELLDDVRSRLPAGSSLYSGAIIGRAPWEPELTAEGPLRAPRVATLVLVVASPQIPDAIALFRSLSKIPGYSDSTLLSSVVENNEVRTTIGLTLNAKAYSERFVPESEKTGDAAGDAEADAQADKPAEGTTEEGVTP